jgi:hypothetical protein
MLTVAAALCQAAASIPEEPMRQRILISLAGLLLLLGGRPVEAAIQPYFYPLVNPYEATVMDLPEAYVARLPEEVPTKVYKLKVFPERKIPDVFWYQDGFSFSLVPRRLSTVGIAGLWDPATSWGLRRQDEDFGQTLGLVVDSVAMSAIDPLNFDHSEEYEVPFNVLYAVDKRKRIPFRYYGTGSPFEYEMVRMLNTKFREFQVKD